jgi:hypothetical protein
MPEYRRKVSPASAFLPVVSYLSPVFRHQGSVRYRWSRIIQALPSSVKYEYGSTEYEPDGTVGVVVCAGHQGPSRVVQDGHHLNTAQSNL